MNIDLSSSFNATVSYNSEIIYPYGKNIDVTLNIQDVSGNLTASTIQFNIIIPPTPPTPVISWINSANLNTTDNQTIRVFRPTTINYIEMWGITITNNGIAYTTINIPISVNYVDITNISDFQIVTAGIFWIDQDSLVSSELSKPATKNITDKTPPIIDNFIPVNNSQRIDSPTSINFIIQDTISGISINTLEFIINTKTLTSTSSELDISATQNGYFVEFIPETYLDFWTTFNVTINIIDIEYNTQQLISSFKTVTTNYHDSTEDKYYRTLQETLTRSTSGNTIEIYPDNYSIAEIIVTKSFTIQSAASTLVTLNGENSHRIMRVDTGVSITLNNLAFINGTNQSSYSGSGASILFLGNNNSIISNCIFKDNTANSSGKFGGSIANETIPSTINLTNCSFINNHADNGGGVFSTDSNISFNIYANEVQFVNNSTDWYGGVSYKTNFQAINCSFVSNNARLGGISYQDNIAIISSNIQENYADNGGAFYDSIVLVIRSLLLNNKAVNGGYAAIGYGDNQYYENCNLYGNTAPNQPTLASGDSCQFINSILWNNNGTLFNNTSDPNTVNLVNCNIQSGQNNVPSQNCITMPPQFVNAPIDFSLLGTDPGINLGTTNITSTTNYLAIYDSYDIGVYEYSAIYISDINPENNSTNITVATTNISFRIRDNSTLVNSTNIQLKLNNIIYNNNQSLSIIDNSTTTADLSISMTTSNALVYSSAITMNISATNNNSIHTIKYSTFYTEDPPLASIEFITPNPLSLVAESTYNISVIAKDVLNAPLSGQLISFTLISNSISNNTRLIEPLTLTTNSNGLATVSINIDIGNAQVVVGATCNNLIADNLTINVTGIIRPIKNIRLSKNYLTIPDALSDTGLTTNDTIFIYSNYAEALPSQHISEITWPNIDNLKMIGEPATLNVNININYAIAANISSLNFVSANKSAIFINSVGSTLNITNCNFIDNNNTDFANPDGGAIYANGINYLEIDNCLFENNSSQQLGGAIDIYGVNNILIQESRFINNSANKGGSIYLFGTNNPNLISKKNIFTNNSGEGSCYYIYASNCNSSFENNLIASNNNTAIYLNNNTTTFNFSTIANNQLAIDNQNGDLTIINSILWNNQDIDISSGTVTLQYCLVSDNALATGPNIITANPQLTTNYILEYDSPAINYATDGYLITEDIRNVSRPQWGGYDIGAYEIQISQPVRIINNGFFNTIQEALDAANENETIELEDTTFALSAPLKWPDTNNLTLKGRTGTTSSDVIIIAPANLEAILVTSNVNLSIQDLSIISANNVFKTNASTAVTINIINTNLQNNHALNNPYTSGSLIFNNLNKLFVDISSCNINNCTSAGNSGLFFSNNLQNVYITINNTLIENIQANNNSIAKNATLNILNSTIKKFKATSGSSGGGCFGSNSFVTISNSSFFGDGLDYNSGYNGIAKNSTIIANNSIFSGVIVINSGGLFSSSQVSLNNCILYGNSAGIVQTTIADNCQITINNSVLWNNINGEFSASTIKQITYSDCDQNYSGTGNFNLDPLFNDASNNDFTINFLSPLIDSGTGDYSVYDSHDVGYYEFQETYINEIYPTQNSDNLQPTTNISFRVRNDKTLLDPANFDIYVDNILFTTATDNLIVTNNSSPTTTDISIKITPAGRFDYSSIITVNLQIDNINYSYLLTMKPPDNIYVTSDGDDNNDGSIDYPYQTIAKAMTIARAGAIILINSPTFSENIIWPNQSEITLTATANAILSGNISIANNITANLSAISVKGNISNSGKLIIDSVVSSYNSTAIENNNYLLVKNSIFSNNSIAIDNNSSAFIYHSNFVSNNLIFDDSGSITAINNIFYNNISITNNISSTITNCLINQSPSFTNNQYKKIDIYSPAIDNALVLNEVAFDIRNISRPQHHKPDIGVWEVEKPSFIIHTPTNLTSTPITSTISFSVIDNIEQLLTNDITISLSGNISFTSQTTGISVNITPDFFFATKTTHNLSLTALDTSGNSSEYILTFLTEPHLTNIYVDKNSTKNNKVGLIDYPFTTIQDAITYLATNNVNSATININEGTYPENITIENNHGNINIVGTNNVVIDGQNSVRIINIGINNIIDLYNIKIINGSANQGAGVYLNSNSTLNAFSITASNNQATQFGGAIYLNDNAYLNLQNSSLISNNAGSQGGAIYNHTAKLDINSSTISGNSSNLQGGALFSYDYSITNINSSIIRNNNSISQDGGAIYNSWYASITVINTNFDYNKALNSSKDGGAIYNYTTAFANIYNCNFISNSADQYGGALYNFGTMQVYNSIFNNNSGTTDYLDFRNSGTMTIYNSLFETASTANQFSTPTKIDLLYNQSPDFVDYAYHLSAQSPAIDSGLDISSITTSDIDNNLRPIDGNGSGTANYDIGIYEYQPNVIIPIGFGYYAEDQDGNRENISANARLTIGREINSVFLGSITIPSENGFNLSQVSFSDLTIINNLIIIPASSALNNNLFYITLPSDHYPFISYNSTIRTDYIKDVINNSDQAITDNCQITENYLITVGAQKSGSFSAVNADRIAFPANTVSGNHNTTTTINISVYTINNVTLNNIPITLNVTGNGSFLDNPFAHNTIYTHGSTAEQFIVTANFESLTTTISILTYIDDLEPTINIISPISTTEVPITTNIIFLVTDNYSGIDFSTTFVLLNNTNITNMLTISENIFTYSERLSINTSYVLTINIKDHGQNNNTLTFNFTTKDDISSPVLVDYSPTNNEINVFPDRPITFSLNDLESGINTDSLVFIVQGTTISNNILLIVSNNYSLEVTYNHSLFNLSDTIPVTISVADNYNNTVNISYGFTITDDFTKPTINIITPTPDASNINPATTINFQLYDADSGINTASLVLEIKSAIISNNLVSFIPSGNTINVIYLADSLGYNQTIPVNILVFDNTGNSSSINYSFSTISDTETPIITPISPLPNDTSVNIFSSIIFELTDNQTGIDFAFTTIEINGNPVNPIDIEYSISGNSYLVTYNPPTQLDYLSTINIDISCYDHAFNQESLAYSFSTDDDVYPPAAPTLNSLNIASTTNINTFTITGEIEYGNYVYIYANNILQTTSFIDNIIPISTFNIPITIDITGNITLSLVAIDSNNNRSTTSNTLQFTIVDNTFNIDVASNNVQVQVPAGALDVEADLNVNKVTIIDPYFDRFSIHYALDFEFVPTGNDAGAPAPTQFNKAITITITIPDTITIEGTPDIYYYDTLSNSWKNDGITVISINGNQITFTTTHFTIFGVVSMANSTSISEYEFILAPNPVQLENEPVHFVYKVTNPSDALIRIYSINGELLTKFEKLLTPGTNEFTWDGENDFNYSIANGVYIVFIKIEDRVTGKTYYKKHKLAVLN
ncbi:hypothetical protein OAR19_00320 [bacterium]|nr:hypothetical protein [bacterium]